MIRDTTPLLAVPDVGAACAFVEQCLGFTTRFSGKGFAGCTRDGGTIRFVQGPDDMDFSDSSRQVMLYIDAEDVDALWQERKAAIGALPEDARQEPADTDHGQREFLLVHNPVVYIVGMPARGEAAR